MLSSKAQPPQLTKRARSIFIFLFICLFTIVVLVQSGHHRRIDGWYIKTKGNLGWTGQTLPKEKLPPKPAEEPGYYPIKTESFFNPVRIADATETSIEEICSSFPKHLLKDIQPVLKTGHSVLDSRVRLQLHSTSACLDNLLIFSDVEEEYMGRQIIDVITDIPKPLRDFESQLAPWRDGAILNNKMDRHKAWKLDKFKFLPSISRAWKENPERKWYVFFEADTYIVWDSMFRLLDNFDPDEPWYFGSPTFGRMHTGFANGGPGYVLSREAMRRLIADDYDPNTGDYLGSKLSERHWYNVFDDCCGDSVLGWALVNVNVSLSGLFPLFSPYPPNAVPFSERFWCKPIITVHKPQDEDVLAIWRWEHEKRTLDRPLLYRDLALSYSDLGQLDTPRENWRTDAAYVAYLAPETESHPHESTETCAKACEMQWDCFTWTYHARNCQFVKSIRYGKAAEPSAEGQEDHITSWTSGWDNVKIQKWIEEHECDVVEWVKPSWERHF